ncbi:Gfo/Idh/MocA family protein [Shumkonia mesophila]|uniref:Gfo/Idh/MocA family protein n=1 Tax=Shumkonia mesophila TaxID=2838854 RepID=UPI0029350F2E|nr:Gfo/Idh/MocA family oxidoreductase [Shumkonia mesophila]
MQPVAWGIVSTAKIGREKVIPALQAGRLTRVVAIASRDLAAAKAVAAKLGIPRAYGTYEELLADPEIEAVYNPLPNHLHVPVSIQAAEAGKHVLCEKPIALTAEEARSLIAVRDRTGVRIQEAFMVRHHPQWRRARDLVREGRIGRLRAIQAFFSYSNVDPVNIRNKADIGGGGIYDIGCYPVVTARFLFGAEPTRVVALIERDPATKVDRLTSAILDFPEGQATFTCSTQLIPYQRVQILGTAGRIEVRVPFNAAPAEPSRIFVDAEGALGDISAKPEEFPMVNQYTLQGDAFSEGIRTGKPAEFPLEDSVRNMRVIDALFRSGKSARWEAL